MQLKSNQFIISVDVLYIYQYKNNCFQISDGQMKLFTRETLLIPAI